MIILRENLTQYIPLMTLHINLMVKLSQIIDQLKLKTQINF